jgi:hypothetical protein
VSDRPDMRAAALAYADAGYRVFPIFEPGHGRCCSCPSAACASPAKHPRTGRGLLDAATDADLVDAWWTRWPRANIGVATGARVIGELGLVVLDVDGDRGADALAELEAEHMSALPATATVRTGSGGFHYWLAAPADVKVKTRGSRSRLRQNPEPC